MCVCIEENAFNLTIECSITEWVCLHSDFFSYCSKQKEALQNCRLQKQFGDKKDVNAVFNPTHSKVVA